MRENERRVEVLGVNPYPVKLLAFVAVGILAVGGGIVYLLLLGGATSGVSGVSVVSGVSGSDFTLGLLVMVVLGGTGRRLGVSVGGVLSMPMRSSRSPDFPVPRSSRPFPVPRVAQCSSRSFC